MIKKVLVLSYSQSGQLERIVDALIAPMCEAEEMQIDYRPIIPTVAYPYPWPFYRFFNVFPEAVMLDGCAIEPIETDESYDLVILAYTSWFLSPSIPVTGFLKSEAAKRLLKGKPVITVIACRDMWIMAQERVKGMLSDIGAVLIDNVVFTDQGQTLYSFVTTPRWMFTGKKDAFWFFPPAGVAKHDIDGASRFGERLVEALKTDEEQVQKPLLKHMGAVNVNKKLIATEKIASRSFRVWSRIIKAAGAQYSIGRNAVITIYVLFLVILIFTVVPLNMLLRKLFYPMMKRSVEQAADYYEQPSGK